MKQLKYNNILFHLLGSYFFVVFSLIMIGGGLNRIESYFVFFSFATISIVYLCLKFKKLYSFNILSASIVGFFAKLLIGYIFFQFYMWPDYFSNPYSTRVFNHYEYLSFWDGIHTIVDDRIENGFFSVNLVYTPSGTIFRGKYYISDYIMSNLFLSGNKNLLDFSIMNSLFSFYTAIISALIGLKLKCSNKQVKIIFLITLFQPFSLITTMIWRDILGQFLVFFSIYILILIDNSKFIKSSLLLFISSISAGIFRTVYIIIPLFIYFIKYLRTGLNSGRKTFNFFIILFLCTLPLFHPKVQNMASFGNYFLYIERLDLIKLIALPLKLFRLLVGPFPWINWLDFNDSNIFLIGNYFGAVYSLVVIFFTVKFYRSSDNSYKFYLLLIFILFFLMSAAGPEINNTYFSFIVPILLSISAKYISIKTFCISYFMFFGGFIILNAIYVMTGLHGLNLGANL